MARRIVTLGILLFVSACGGSQQIIPIAVPVAPSPVAPAAGPVSPAPVARLAMTIDRQGALDAIAALSTVTFDASASSGTGLRFGLDFGDGKGADEATATHVYLTGSRTYKARVIVTDEMGRIDSVSVDIPVRGVEGDWNNSILNASTKRYESRTLTITSQSGQSLTGTYAHPEGNRSIFTGQLTAQRTAIIRLNDGTITFGTASDIGFNGDATRLTLTVRGGSADGQQLTFTRYVPNNNY